MHPRKIQDTPPVYGRMQRRNTQVIFLFHDTDFPIKYAFQINCGHQSKAKPTPEAGLFALQYLRSADTSDMEMFS